MFLKFKLFLGSKISMGKAWFAFFILLLALLFAWFFNKDYFLFSFQIALGLIILPFIITPNNKYKGELKYAVLFCLFLLLSFVFTLQVFLFLAWGCLLLFMIEYYYGEIGFLPFVFLISVSPALYYVVNIFSFPIRLQLSELTCFLFNLVGLNIVNKGSYFVLSGGQEFHIDQACVGLKMFGTGFISAIIILAFRQKKLGIKIPLGKLFLWMSLMAILLLLTNLFRIMGLVFFKSMPETLSHNLIGMFALFIYAVLPYYFLVNQFLKTDVLIPKDVKTTNLKFSHAPLLFLVLAAFLSFKFKEARVQQRQDLVLAQLEIPGFTKMEKEDGVMEFKNDSFLIYIKPAMRPFEGGHPPQICWRASGFDLCNFNEFKIGNSSYMFGLLKKNSQQQYTAWWYDNGSIQTIHEWEWRRKNEAPFRVVNICAKDSSTLVHILQSGLAIPGITVALNQTQLGQ